MDPILIAMLGLVIGLALLIVEFFIPSGGLIFVVACVSLLAGTWGAWQAWSGEHMTYFWIYLVSLIILAPGSVFGGLYLLDNTSLGNNVLLTPPTKDEVEGFEKASDKLRELVGNRGKAMGLLNPGGMVLVEGQRFHCETPGMMIDPGTEVEVIEVSGNRLVVRVPFESETSNDNAIGTADQEPQTDAPASTEVVNSSPVEEETESFDFDIPEDSQDSTT